MAVPVRLEEVPAAGQRFALEADAATRAGLSAAAGLAGMPRLTATFDVARHGRDGLHVAGTVWATVQQTCVVTLGRSRARRGSDRPHLRSGGRARSFRRRRGEGARATVGGREDDIETLVNGTVDLGALAIEFLLLGIDPYPRAGRRIRPAPADEPGG